MNENFYLSIDELCTLEQTDALLTLGMGTERLYYEEQSGHYLFPLSSAIKWIRETKALISGLIIAISLVIGLLIG